MRSLWAVAVCLGGLLAGCAAQPKQAAARPAEVAVEALAPGLWMHTSFKDIAPWGPVLSHGLVVEQGGVSVLVDTAWDDAQTAQVLDWAAHTLGKPVRRAVLTHAHEDKMGGVALLRRRGVETFAHALSNRWAPQRGLVPAERDLDLAPGQDSEALAPLIVHYPGPGHAVDNLVVYAPEARVLFGGCLVRPGDATGLGNTADADVPAWGPSVERVRARFPDAAVVVPSHGAPGGPALLAHTVALTRAAQAP